MASESDRHAQPTVTPATGAPLPANPPAPQPTTAGDPSETGPYACGTHSAGSPDSHELPQIPGYAIECVLGHGGMGIVYKARQIKADRTVALKMILSSKHISTQEQIRFQIEVEAVARLQHPNIVQIHEIGEHDGNPYFSLEFCAGGNLGKRLKQQRPKAAQAAKLIETLARAMHYAHLHGVVHRDLKPANVLLDGAGQPKIADFGLAKRLDTNSEVSQTGAVLGTPAYMAPEQAAGKVRDTGPGTDVYALGATLYELLTGQPPFRSATNFETIHRVLTEEAPRPSRIAPSVPRDLETICLKCLQKNAGNRYASAELLADDLQRFLEDRPIHARPASALETLWRWCRRNPTRALLSASVAVLVLGIAVTSSLLAYREYQAKKDLTHSNEKLVQAQQAQDAALKHALSSAARFAIDRSISRCEQEDTARGMLTLANAVALAAEAGDRDLESAARFNLASWERQLWRLRAILPAPEGTHVWRAALSPRGDCIAVALANRTAQLWSSAAGSEGRLLHSLPHSGLVADLTFSADGKLLLTRTERTVTVWNVAEGKPACPAIEHNSKILTAALSADGKLVLTGGDDKTARLWAVDSGTQVGEATPHRSAVTVVAFAEHGGLALSAAGNTLRVWNVASPNSASKELQAFGNIATASFSADGLNVLAGTGSKRLHVWQTASGVEVFPAIEFDDSITEAAFSPNGAAIAARTLAGAAHVRNARSGTVIGAKLPDPGRVVSIAFSPDSKSLLTAGFNGVARIWDATRERQASVELHHPDKGYIRSCAFSADGRTVLTVDGTVRLWHAPAGIRRGPPLRHNGARYAVALSLDGNWMLTDGDDGIALVRNTAVPDAAPVQLEHGARIAAVAFSTDSQTAVTAGADGIARLWNVKTGTLITLLKGHTGSLYAVACSPDGSTILTGGFDKTARLWQSSMGRPLGAPLTHQGFVNTVAFSPDGTRAATGSADHSARIWDVATQQMVGQPLVHQGDVDAVAFSPDGRIVYSADNRGNLHFWDAATGAELATRAAHTAGIHSIAVSRDGKLLLTASADKSAQLFDALTAEPWGVPFQHQDVVRDAAFGVDGSTVLTGSFDKTARRWHIATGIPIGPAFTHAQRIRAIVQSPDGRSAATASWDGTAMLWETPAAWDAAPDELMRRVEVATGMELKDGVHFRMLDTATWRERRSKIASSRTSEMPE